MFDIRSNWLTLVCRLPDLTILAFTGGVGRTNSDLVMYTNSFYGRLSSPDEPFMSVHLYRRFRSYYK